MVFAVGSPAKGVAFGNASQIKRPSAFFGNPGTCRQSFPAHDDQVIFRFGNGAEGKKSAKAERSALRERELELRDQASDATQPEKQYARLVAVSEQLYGIRHPQTTGRLYQLAETLHENASYAIAQLVRQRMQALRDGSSTDSPDQPLACWLMSKVHQVPSSLLLEDILAANQVALETLEEIEGKDSPALAFLLHGLASNEMERNELTSAVEYAKRAADVIEKAPPAVLEKTDFLTANGRLPRDPHLQFSNHSQVRLAGIYFQLGEIYERMGPMHFDESEGALFKGVQLCKNLGLDKLGDTDLELYEAYEPKVRIYFSKPDPIKRI